MTGKILKMNMSKIKNNQVIQTADSLDVKAEIEKLQTIGQDLIKKALAKGARR